MRFRNIPWGKDGKISNPGRDDCRSIKRENERKIRKTTCKVVVCPSGGNTSPGCKPWVYVELILWSPVRATPLLPITYTFSTHKSNPLNTELDIFFAKPRKVKIEGL
jgi:hypothetical protein